MIPTIHETGKLLYEQIYDFYKNAILTKRMKYNDRLPSYRVLAKELGVGNNTVLKAYEQLVLEGYVKNEHRKGLYVTMIENADWHLDTAPKKDLPVAGLESRNTKADFNAAVQLVDEKNFPVKHWRKCSNWALDHISFQYQEHEGHDPLKDQLIKYLFNYRGVYATPERLLIGSGASALVFWLAFILRKSCKKIVIEEPGYSRIRLAFSEFDYKVKPIRVIENGLDLKKLLKEKADLLYLTPSHQYPTGAAIPVNHRLKMLSWAKKNNAWIIEDDFDCEFRYRTKLMPSLQGLDRANKVIYVGTFSSALMPSLRVAFVVLPEKFPVEFRAYRYLTNTVPYFTRKTLSHFMEQGYWERHLKKMRNIYKNKYEACIETLKELPQKHVQFNNAPSGLNILLRVHTGLSESEMVRRARENGVLITPGSEFYAEKRNIPRYREVLLEFGSLQREEIPKVVKKLYTAWFGENGG